jgi:hypothetical protein
MTQQWDAQQPHTPQRPDQQWPDTNVQQHLPGPHQPSPPTPTPLRSGRRRLGIVGGVFLLLLAGIGIGLAIGSAKSSSTATAAAPAVAPPPPVAAGAKAGSPSVAATTASAPIVQQPGVVAFGQRFTWKSGIAVEVAQPEAFTPSRTAAGDDGDRAVIVTTTVINGSDEPYQFNEFIMGPTITHGGQAATRIFDAENKLSISPVSTILPGKSFTYRSGFSLGAASAELQLQYSEQFGSDPGIYVGRV